LLLRLIFTSTEQYNIFNFITWYNISYCCTLCNFKAINR